MINPLVSQSLDVSYGTFTLLPADLEGYTISYSQFESVSNADPSWATLNTGSSKTTIATTSNSDAGTYTMTIRGAATGADGTFNGDATFTVYLIKIVTTTLTDMELSLGRGDKSQAVSAWSYTPNTGIIASYTI